MKILISKAHGWIRRSNPVLAWMANFGTVVSLIVGATVGAGVMKIMASPANPANDEAGSNHHVKDEIGHQPLLGASLQASPYNRLHTLPLGLAAADEGSVPVRSADGKRLMETAASCLNKLKCEEATITLGGTIYKPGGVVTADQIFRTVRGADPLAAVVDVPAPVYPTIQ